MQQWYRTNTSRVGGPESRVVVNVFDDITESKRRERNTAFLDDIGKELSRLSTPDQIMQTVGERLGKFLYASSCIFADVDEAKNEATIHHGWNTVDVPSLKQTFRLADYFGEEFARAGRAGETVIVSDTDRDERADAEAYVGLRLGAFVTVPFQRHGRWTANITITSREARDWRADEVALVKEIATRVFPRIERARAEEALRASEELLRALLENLPGGAAFVVDPDLRYLLAEGEALHDIGMTASDFVGKTPFEVLPPEQAAVYAANYRQAFSGESFVSEHQTDHHIYLTRGTPLRDTQGNVYAVLALSYDITERKHAETLLRESEERQVFLLKLSDALRALADEKTIEETGLRILAEFLRLDRAYVFVLFPSEDRAVVRAEQRNEDLASLVGEVRMSDFPETVRQIEDQTLVVNDIDSDARLSDLNRTSLDAVNLQAFVCASARTSERGVIWSLAATSATSRTWTRAEIELIEIAAERLWAAAERAKTEASLRESEARFRTLSDAVPQVIWSNLADGTANYFNGRWYEYSGLSYEQSVGPGWQAIVHPKDASASVAEWQHALAAGIVFDTEYRLRRYDGTYRWFIGRNIPLKDSRGNVIGWFGSATAIEELKQAQEAVRISLEAIGIANEELEERVQERTRELSQSNAELVQMSQMRQELLRKVVTAQEDEAGRISRDLHDDTGQQVAALLLNLRNLKNRSLIAQDDTAQTLLDQVEALAQEIAQKSHRLSFTLRPTALDDQGLVAALHNYTEEWKRWSHLPIDFISIGLGEERLPREIESTVYRVTQEALTNILKYATGLGRETSGADASAATQVNVTLRRTKELLVAIVEDDGPGFDVEAVLHPITGKRRLGLFGMQERARLAGGTLTIESEPGEGTTIYLRIPLPESVPAA